MLIYGFGSHAKIIMESLQLKGEKADCFFDDNSLDGTFNNIPIISKYDCNFKKEQPIIIGIGNNKIRKELKDIIKHKFGISIDKTALISKYSKIGEGTVILPNVIIQYNSKVGIHSIINVGSFVDHDTTIGDFVNISPNVTICNNCDIGDGSIIEASAIIGKNVTIGKNSHIAYGSIISASVPDEFCNT